jgi:hypothetical protein
VAERLFPDRPALGARISIGGYPFRVVGVLAERGQIFGESMDNQIFLPLGALFRCFGRHRSIDIGVRVAGQTRRRAGVPAADRGGARRDRRRHAARGSGRASDNFAVNEQPRSPRCTSRSPRGLRRGSASPPSALVAGSASEHHDGIGGRAHAGSACARRSAPRAAIADGSDRGRDPRSAARSGS